MGGGKGERGGLPRPFPLTPAMHTTQEHKAMTSASPQRRVLYPKHKANALPKAVLVNLRRKGEFEEHLASKLQPVFYIKY